MSAGKPKAMRILLLANIGSSDVQDDRDARSGDKSTPSEPPRIRGERLLNNYDAEKAHLSIPIIRAAVDWIRDQAMPEEPRNLSVALFATDQPEDTPETHRQWDTLYFAEIVKRLLKERYADDPGAGWSLADPKVYLIQNENPGYYDRMYAWFGAKLAERWFQKADPPWDQCYVLATGGTPAMNFGLLLRSLVAFSGRAEAQMLYVPRGADRPVPMNTGRQLRLALVVNQARRDLQRNEFAAAARLIDSARDGTRELWLAAGLARCAAARLDFDFATARQTLDGLLPEMGADRDQLRGWADEIDRLRRRDDAARIRELYFNARIAYENERYVDFLLRLFRLQEAALRWVVERELHLPTEPENGKAADAFIKGIESDPNLRAHVEQEEIDGRKLDYTREPNMPMLRQLLAYLAKQPERGETWPQVQDVIDRLNKLTPLRNKSIGAHGFEGVSRERLEKAYEGGDVLADLTELLRLLGVETGHDPYALVRELIVKQLDAAR